MDPYDPHTWPSADATTLSSADFDYAVELVRADLGDVSYVPVPDEVRATESYVALPSVGIGSGGYVFDRNARTLHPIASGQRHDSQVWMIANGLDRWREDSTITVTRVLDLTAARAVLREMLNARTFWNDVNRRLDEPPVVLHDLRPLIWYPLLYEANLRGAFDFTIRQGHLELAFPAGHREGEVQQGAAG